MKVAIALPEKGYNRLRYYKTPIENIKEKTSIFLFFYFCVVFHRNPAFLIYILVTGKGL